MSTVRCTMTLISLITLAVSSAAEQPFLSQHDVFVSGQGGYHTYRIPSVIVTPKGTVLAFCEGRKSGRSDTGDIDLLLRRSNDGGLSWSTTKVVWDDADNTCGNACPVVDQQTGVIWLLLTWNAGNVSEGKIQPGFAEDSRRVFVTHSDDDGISWAEPKEITSSTKRADWSWYATGPGAGIQIVGGTHRDRMVIPCDHKIPSGGETRFGSHVIYSDDHGTTWQLGGCAPEDKVNECEVVELAGGRLMLNMRNYDPSLKTRQVCYSDDGGDSWYGQRHDAVLTDPVCQASIRRYRWPQGDQPGMILFSNPARSDARSHLTIRASEDDGETWKHSRLLNPGSSAYSCLCVLPDATIGCLYEKDDYKRLSFARFPLAWVEQGNGPPSEIPNESTR